MLNTDILGQAKFEIDVSGQTDVANVSIQKKWGADYCKLSVVNKSDKAIEINEVTVFSLPMPYPLTTEFYGEGYSKLSQYKGTLESFENITGFSDYKHYKLPQKAGFFTVYNMLMLFPVVGEIVLLGFSSCKRFSGEFRFNTEQLEIVLDCEGLTLEAGETLELEEFCIFTGDDREDNLEKFAERIESNHPRLPYPKTPTGWCSWYCYGPDVTEQDVFDNLNTIKNDFSELEFIQLDDGYQNKMGDWLIPHPNFPGGIKPLCLEIKEQGFEPAIWVAPFIAEESSELFKNHPAWFVADDNGAPLSSGDVTFGGWRCAPWYMLDGTHPEAQKYLIEVFRTMREEWQCTYFKLDANVWGAMPFGNYYDKTATRVDAYRAGMQAVIEGAGEDSFILGCNAPMWPSIGVVHGMRTTGDISRNWDTFETLAEECFHRNWQDKKLWHNDPDCLVLKNLTLDIIGPDGKPTSESSSISDDEFSFHAAHILASGGMMLASDRMMELDEKEKHILGKLLPPQDNAARFDDMNFRVGRIETKNGFLLCLFNWNDKESKISVPLYGVYDIADFWNDEVLATAVDKTPTITLAPHSARVLRCEK